MATIGRTLVRLTGAVLLGASATSIDNPGVLNDVGVTAHARVATVPVVVAAKDLPEGAIIDRTTVVIAQWPAGTQPAAAFSSVEFVAGRVMSVAVFKGEVIVPGRLAPDATPPGLEARITPGKRAFAVRFNDAAGIAGMVQPNTRVDIMVTINSDAAGKRVAKLFMENMRVLGIGWVVERTKDGLPINAHVASIEVTPAEAERLAIAQKQGEIQLVLRGYGDPGSIQQQERPRPMVTDLLLRRSEVPSARVFPAPIRPARPDTAVVKVFRGGRRAGESELAKDTSVRAKQLQKRP